MSLDAGTFETLVPSRFMTFTFPNPNPTTHHPLHTPLLRVAVLDSPIQDTTTTDLPRVAAMLVPNHRETDWTFSTEHGHLQLLLNSPQVSRLILIGDLPNASHPTTPYNRQISIDPTHRAKLEERLTPLLIALSPKSAFKKGLPEIPFLTYEDDVIRSVIVERCVGPFVGEMLVEDVELEGKCETECNREFRRRLRFKRMPNLIQTQLRIIPNAINDESGCLGDMEFKPDIGVLVHPYLTPMVAGLSLIASHIDEQIQCGLMPKALCLGVGGGALLGFLNAQLGFEVVGLEADGVVLRVARQYFGLKEGEFFRVSVGDGIELIKRLAHEEKKRNIDSSRAHKVMNGCQLDEVDGFDTKFDVIMVDLDSCDARMGISAPPLEFVNKPVLWAARLILHELGILVINVIIPPNGSFYDALIHEFREVFQELYEIDVGNGENFVLIATASPIGAASSETENPFITKLKLVISGAYTDSIRKI